MLFAVKQQYRGLSGRKSASVVAFNELVHQPLTEGTDVSGCLVKPVCQNFFNQR